MCAVTNRRANGNTIERQRVRSRGGIGRIEIRCDRCQVSRSANHCVGNRQDRHIVHNGAGRVRRCRNIHGAELKHVFSG